MDSDHANPLFRAPVKDPKHILDLGTGLGNWAMYVGKNTIHIHKEQSLTLF